MGWGEWGGELKSMVGWSNLIIYPEKMGKKWGEGLETYINGFLEK